MHDKFITGPKSSGEASWGKDAKSLDGERLPSSHYLVPVLVPLIQTLDLQAPLQFNHRFKSYACGYSLYEVTISLSCLDKSKTNRSRGRGIPTQRIRTYFQQNHRKKKSFPNLKRRCPYRYKKHTEHQIEWTRKGSLLTI